ncbi:MAG: Fe(3+) ABC transporter substrate-binding protein [Pseudomonadota bacterium]
MIRPSTAFFRGLLAAATLFFLSACGDQASEPVATDQPSANASTGENGGEVNLYSSRHYDTDLRLYDDFTAATGIKVNLIEAGADELIERIKNEGAFSPADVLLTVDAGRLWRAEQAGVLQPVESDMLTNRVPENLRHPDGLWFGLSKRARVIVYNKEAGRPAPLDTYEDLADPAHRGRVCIRSSGNIYNISLLAGLVARLGSEAAESWAKGVVENFARPPQSNDTGQLRAVASGECGIAVVNTYYLARLAASDDPAEQAVANAVGIIFPNQETSGTHVNISGGGVVTTSPNRNNAVKFLEYLTSDQAQRYFANGNNEYPAVTGLDASSVVEALGTFAEDQLNASLLGQNQAEAIMVFDRAGWK